MSAAYRSSEAANTDETDDVAGARVEAGQRIEGSRLRRVPSLPSPVDIEALAARTDFLWHQRFELAPGIFSAGSNDVDWLLHTAGVPADLSGASVLDIGTTNGGAAFTLERRGAARVLATDIVEPMHFGFEAIRSECQCARLANCNTSAHSVTVPGWPVTSDQTPCALTW